MGELFASHPFHFLLTCAALACTGGLDPDKVHKLLSERSPNVAFAMGDVLVLLEQCDVDGSGAIEKNEMPALLQMWDDKAKTMPAKKASSCVIL